MRWPAVHVADLLARLDVCERLVGDEVRVYGMAQMAPEKVAEARGCGAMSCSARA
jgi:hypothetical protein